MQDNSFDSFNLDEYVLDVEGFFNDYIIHKRKFKKDYAVFQGVMKDSPQAVKIYKRLFPTDLESRQRFHVLMNAFQQGIVLADNIFLSFENGKYYIYVVEPAFSSYQDKFIQLSHLLKLDLDYFKKHRLFQNLVIMLKSLHALGEPHMEICPKNIWVEDQFLVYLRPFKLKIENQNLFNWRKLEKLRDVNSSLKFNNNSKYWYMSPEQVICDTNRKPPTHTQNPTSHTQIDGFASDVWSLGCIFAEMFVSLTPVFQSVDSFDRTIRFFEVLGVPPREDVYYMTKELYARVIEELHSRTFNEDEFPLIQELVKNLSKNEEKVLSSLLMFNPNKRPRCENLIEFPFFKTFAPKKQKHEEENAKSSNNFIQIRSLLNGGDVPTGKSTREDEEFERGIYTRKNTKDMINQGAVYSSRNNTENTKERQHSGNWWNLDLGGVPKGEQSNINNALKPSNRMENQQSRTGNQAMPLNSSVKKGNSISNVMKSAQKSNSKYQPLNERVQTDTYERSPSHPFKETLNTESGVGSGYKNKGQGSWTSRNFQNQNENNPTNYEYSPNMPPKQNVGMTPMSGKSSRQQYNSNQKRQSMPSVPKARLCVSIETLKNLSTRYPHGSYSCRVDIKPKTTDTEPINLFSNFADVQNRAAKLDFKGEADLELDSFVASFNKEPLKIYVFCRNTPFGVAKGGSEVFLYGVSEIDMSLLLMNGSFETGLDNERIKTISGWYHVYDPDDHYRTLGQMKIEIQFLLLSKNNGPRVPPSSSRDIRTRTNLDLTNSVSQKIRFEDSHNTRPSGRSLSSAQARTNITPSQTVYEEKRHPLPRSMRKSSQISQPIQHNKNSSIFENIQTDLSKLNDNLKRREHEKAHSMSVRNYSQGPSDLGVTLQRLRHVLEDSQMY